MSKKVLKIMQIGLSVNDLQVVKSLCWISVNRPRAYAMQGPGELPDFYLVDGDKPEAVALCEKARARHAAPVVLLTSGAANGVAHHVLRRPVVASRMLGAFDEVAIHLLGHTPELSIGEEAELPGARIGSMIRGAELPGAAGPRLGWALVVDDSPTVRKQLEFGLQNLGVDVDVAEDGNVALNKLAANRYDIVFLDVVLPGADGYQICKAIKKDKSSKETPVIMLTSKSSPFDRIKGSLAGCDTYLAKPVDNATFRGVVEKYLGTRQANAAAGNGVV